MPEEGGHAAVPAGTRESERETETERETDLSPVAELEPLLGFGPRGYMKNVDTCFGQYPQEVREA